MKKLTLVRHAKSSWKDPDLNDFDRPLNKRGKRDLSLVAQRVAGHQLIPDQMLSSGAKRAYKTAKAIATYQHLPAQQLEVIPELYEACAETLLYILQNSSDKHNHVMLVGHNPGLEMLAYLLTQQHVDKFPTAVVMHLHLSITRWSELAEGCATCTLFDYPKQHTSAEIED